MSSRAHKMTEPSSLGDDDGGKPNIRQMCERLQGRRPTGRVSGAPQAGVLVPVIDGDTPSLLYVLRSKHLPTHAGEVAFPGGKREAGDKTLWDTALRESREEVDLDSSQLQLLGQLDRTMSRFGLEVTPCVALLSEAARWKISSPETERIFTVPIEQLLYREPDAVDVFQRGDAQYRLPRWKAGEGMEIWGLTAQVTADFLRQAFDDRRELCNHEPV